MQATRSRTLGLWVASLFLLQTPVCAPAADAAAAIQALQAFKDGCKRAEALWPARLCGPIVLVDPRTRAAIANQADPTGQFKREDGMFVANGRRAWTWQTRRWIGAARGGLS